MILKNCRIFDGESFISENVIVLKEDKIVKIIFEKDLGEELMNDEVIDIQGNIISPGFIDLQLNGCGGVLFNDDISLETLKTMNETNKKYGCTSFLPTLITSPDEKIENASHKLFLVDTETGNALNCWQILVVEFNGQKTVL